MDKTKIKSISFVIILILILNLVFPIFIPGFKQEVKASSVNKEDAYKGLGIALIIILFSKMGDFMESSPSSAAKDDQIELLAKVIHAEARGEPFLGQVGVGAVILNRKNSSDFPNTIKEILYQSEQFTSVKNGQINLTPNNTAYKAAQECIEGKDPTGGALFFYNPENAKTRKWFEKNTKITEKIGNHVFAVSKKSAAAVNIF